MNEKVAYDAKPAWSTAPQWARYLAQDRNGEWFWFQKEPVANYESENWQPKNGGMSQQAYCVAWELTMESRP